MKRFTKTKKVLLTLGIIFTFSILLSTNFSHYQSKSYGYLESYNEQKLKNSGYWEIEPIEINYFDPFKNWSYTASTYDWCSGNGTIVDPYIIENVTINGDGSGYCILITYSNVYFKIQNCTVFNSGLYYSNAGIKLENTNNGQLINNTCSNNNNAGINLRKCDNNIVSGNTVNYNYRYGMYLNDCNNNTISGNTASYSGDDGIYFHGGENNIISGNTASYSGDDGISLIIDDSTISENTMNYNYRGIYFYLSDNNDISGNSASYNDGNGMWLSDSNYNTISGNTASYNDGDGIYLSESDYNDILGNDITNNTNLGIDLSRSNYNTVSGNNLIGNDRCIREYECEGNVFENNDCDVVEDDKKPAIPGYNLFFLFGILSVVAIIISKKVRDL